jgi:hypothetical protein
VFLLSTKAGGFGINLTCANAVRFFFQKAFFCPIQNPEADFSEFFHGALRSSCSTRILIRTMTSKLRWVPLCQPVLFAFSANCFFFFYLLLENQDRAHRVGQTRNVIVTRLVSEHTVEERILSLAKAKLQLDTRISSDRNEVVDLDAGEPEEEEPAGKKRGAKKRKTDGPDADAGGGGGKGENYSMGDVLELLQAEVDSDEQQM